jgi:GNAT superfamily N-acetyltransferase
MAHDPAMQHSTRISLTGPAAGMFDAWFSLFERYSREAGMTADRRAAGTLWRWLLDGTYRIAGLLALDQQKNVVGFVHYRPFPHTLTGTEACSIDDLYVSESHRADGLLEELINSVCVVARKRGWTEVRWTDRDTDAAATGIYNGVAQRLPLATYRIPLT